MKLIQRLGAVTLAGLLAACGSPDVILEGERYDIRDVDDAFAEEFVVPGTKPPEEARSLSLSRQVNHSTWSHRNGSPQHRIQHPALSTTPRLIWTAEIGQGNDRRHRIATPPVAAAGRVFAMDSRARVTAVSAANGGVLWSKDLTPARDRTDDASGGSLAVVDGKVFVTTGFGELVALDAATGAEAWRQKYNAGIAGAPTVSNGLVYIAGRDGIGRALRISDARVQWELPGIPPSAVRVGGAGPAITDRLVLFPFGSGELIGATRRNGARVWGTTVSSAAGSTRANLAFADLTADPVVVGGTVYSGNQGGRMAAVDTADGERIWTSNVGAIDPVWPEGGSLFLISDENDLVRLDARNGEVIWERQLPLFLNSSVRRRKGVYAHFGPIIAGGRLLIASDDGMIRSYDPAAGTLISMIEMGEGASSAPIVVGGTMFIVTKDGKLRAFR